MHCSFSSEKSKHVFYTGEESMETFCRDLRKHVLEITDCKKYR